MKWSLISLGGLACCAWFLSTAEASKVTYVYTDPTGTPLAEADENGHVNTTSDYAPYGTQVLGTPPDGPGFTGHVNDLETMLVYMQGRFYDPATTRFLSVDPAASISGDFFGFNRYAYGASNPLKYIDPTGKVLKLVENPKAPHAGKNSMQELLAQAKADPLVAPLIKTLEESDKVHVLTPAGRQEGSKSIPDNVADGTVGPDGKPSAGTGTTIKIQLGYESVKMTDKDGDTTRRKVPLVEKLLHESDHSVTYDQGAMPTDGTVNPVTGNPASEQSPMDKENEWRDAHDLPGRRWEY